MQKIPTGPMPPQNVVQTLTALQNKMAIAFREGNADWIAHEFYAKNAWVFGPEDSWAGTSQIKELYEGVVSVYTWKFRSVNMIFTGDSVLDFVDGRIESTIGEDPINYRILFAWQLIDGKWQCITQMFTEGFF